MPDLTPHDQELFAAGMALKDAAKSHEGQLYHRLLMEQINLYIDRLFTMGPDRSNDEIAAVVHKMQAIKDIMGVESDVIRKGLQVGQRLAAKAGLG